MPTNSISRLLAEEILPLSNTALFGPEGPVPHAAARRHWSARIDLDCHEGLPGAVCLTGSPRADDVIISVLFFSSKASPNGSSPGQLPTAERVATEQFNLDGRDTLHISQWIDARLEECRRKVLARAS
ncbi:MAG TPA: hypothetical protein VMV69_00730 [Pirellulales bacterium]|nr:hypothetical protein [Pirellulales bacterium]